MSRRLITLKNSAFTLVEVLVFVSIGSLLLLAAVNITSFSVNRLKGEQYKVLGNYFMDSLFEWLAGEKESDWGGFKEKVIGVENPVYCFNDLELKKWPPPGKCRRYTLAAQEFFGGKRLFQRELELSLVGANTIRAKVTVRWKDRGKFREVKGVRTYSFIER